MSTRTRRASVAPTPRKRTTFGDHINELRIRLMWIALVFISLSALAYNFRDVLIDIVLSPLGNQQLIYLTPAGGFAFIFQVTMYAGAVATAPFFIYHVYKFVQPALPSHARRYSLRIIAIATLLMLAGVNFGYFVAVPAALHFLTTFAGDFVAPSLTADAYLSFIIAYVVGLGLLFQLPLLLVFWNWISPLKPGKLLDTQRYMVVFSFVAAAIITPTPDIVNQSLIAGPIIAIYQLGVIAVFIMNRRATKKAAKAPRLTQPTSRPATSEALPPRRSSPLMPAAVAPQPVAAVAVPVRPIVRSIDGFRARPATLRTSRVTSPVSRTLPASVRPLPRLERRGGAPRRALDGISHV